MIGTHPGPADFTPTKYKPSRKHKCGEDTCFIGYPFPNMDTILYYLHIADKRMICDYQLRQYVAFTWNPNPGIYGSTTPSEQWISVLPHLLSGIRCIKNYCFVPELTDQGNIHVHGVYQINDKVKYAQFWLPRLKRLGFTCIKTRVDCKWLGYIWKHQVFMRSLLMDSYVPHIIWEKNETEWKHLKKVQIKRTLRLCRTKRKVKQRNLIDYGLRTFF